MTSSNKPPLRPGQNAADPARRLALELLARVLDDRRPLDDVLAAGIGQDTVSPRDRAFTRHLVASTLRHLGSIDRLIDGRLARPLPRGASRIRHILRLGVCQLQHMRVPAHAAVNGCVALVDGKDRRRFGGLVNALLRRLAERTDAPAGQADRARQDTPDWLWKSWAGFYGEAVCTDIARAHQDLAPLDLTLKRGNAEAWAERLGARRLPQGGLRLPPATDPTGLEGFTEGAWWVQDAAASLPARLFGPVAGLRLLDMCAAPGGKTAQLAAAGARVSALDRSAPRMERLGKNLERLSLEAECVVAPAESWTPPEPFDGILLDAPCSATGTLRRHPDIAWLKSPRDVENLARTQRRLILAALDMLRPGGVLVYCTCSLQPEEGEAQMEWLLSTDRRVATDPIRAGELPGMDAAVTPAGMLRTLPCHWPDLGGMDGFFCCRLRKS